MKKIKCLSFALAALMLGACSSDETVIVDDNGGKPSWNADGQGYVNLAINLPTTSQQTRNDGGIVEGWDDGELKEYDVKDATLILFTKAEEADPPTIHSAYDMDLNFKLDGTDAVTSVARITQAINATESKNISALVVLNRNGLFSVADGDLKVGSTSVKGNTLGQLNEKISEVSKDNWHGEGFLMSNAVLATKPGGDRAPETGVDTITLVPIDGSRIFATKTEADAKPAANIYVERAESKVTLSAKISGTENTDETYNVTGSSGLSYKITKWALDNTNKTSKLVRTVEKFENWNGYASGNIKSTDATNITNQKYRFVGNKEVGTKLTDENVKYYRIYWGNDFNYDNNTDESDAFKSASVPGTDSWKDVGESDYCFENTTDVANMLEKNCTRVLIEATFNGGEEFYTMDDMKDRIYIKEDVQKEVAARLMKNPDVANWLKENLKEGKEFLSTDFEIKLSDAQSGKITVSEVSEKIAEGDETKLKNGIPETFAEYANGSGDTKGCIDIKYYEDGKSYYSVWVAHFGDDLTPWSKDDVDEVGLLTVSNIYGTTNFDENYLGRWGMLRNNWYQIEVTGIKSLGSPTIEEVTNNTIDKVESYVSFNIYTLPWAIRKQSVVL